MTQPLVSILIPVYNRANLVGETIDSAIGQTYKNIEIIIVDNCSTDGTWELLKEYKKKDNRIRIFQNKKNIGPVRNWKRCIDEANGEYAKILFSDDLISENFVEVTVSILQNNPKTAFVISNIILKDYKSELDIKYLQYVDKTVTVKRLNFLYYKLFGFKNYPNSPGCALFRRSDLEKNILINIPNPFGWDFSIYGAGNDLLLFLSTATNYKSITQTMKTYSIFRGHPNSFSTANKLKKYYDFSKLYFARKNKLWMVYILLKLYILFKKQ